MIPNPFKAKFILFEGIDGSGKSQQYLRFQNFMNAYFPGISVDYLKEPDKDRPIGAEIYQIIKGKHLQHDLQRMSSYHLQAFYIEDRMINYREGIIPALMRGSHVAQDRGVASSFCYGSEATNEFADLMGLHDRIFSAAQMPFLWPDIILIFDVPVGVARERMIKSGKELDQFETTDKLSRVRENYIAFAETYPGCVVIDGTPNEQTIFSQVKTHLVSTLALDSK